MWLLRADGYRAQLHGGGGTHVDVGTDASFLPVRAGFPFSLPSHTRDACRAACFELLKRQGLA